MKVSIKRIGKSSKRAPPWGQAIMTEVHRQLSADRTVLSLAKGITSDWKHKPKFRTRVVKHRGSLTTELQATGKNAKIWYWVSLGTKGPYKIPKVKGSTLLKFRGGYKPRTTPKGKTATFGGPGVATGPWVSAQQVEHPGIKARDFEGLIRSKYTQTFRRIIREAVKRGGAMASKGVVRITYKPSAYSKWRRG